MTREEYVLAREQYELDRERACKGHATEETDYHMTVGTFTYADVMRGSGRSKTPLIDSEPTEDSAAFCDALMAAFHG